MEDTHTGARVERVKSFVSLYTVHSLLTVESWATCVCIAKLDLLTVVHTNELFLDVFFLVYFVKLHAVLYLTMAPLNQTLRSQELRKWSPTKDCWTNSPNQHLRKSIENSMENSSLWWDWAHKWWDCYIWLIWLCDDWKQVWQHILIIQ